MGSVRSTIEEIVSRQFLLVGFIALTLMLPLAVTSTNAMIRKLGSVRWKLLHRLAYVAAILGVVHYYMLVKATYVSLSPLRQCLHDSWISKRKALLGLATRGIEVQVT